MSTPDPKPAATTDADAKDAEAADAAETPATAAKDPKVEEIGGPKGPDPTRFGDWSVNGRCFDF